MMFLLKNFAIESRIYVKFTYIDVCSLQYPNVNYNILTDHLFVCKIHYKMWYLKLCLLFTKINTYMNNNDMSIFWRISFPKSLYIFELSLMYNLLGYMTRYCIKIWKNNLYVFIKLQISQVCTAFLTDKYRDLS